MPLRLHDTLSGAKLEFRPAEPGVVRMYTCGPTIWSLAHVGNFRAFLFYDLLRRKLESSGWRVEQVLNLTDVDDRIIEQAALARTTIHRFTQPFADAFFEDLRTLRAEPAEHYPRATGHVPEIIDLIRRLLDGGFAYLTEDGVYFRVGSFPAYGALSHLDRAGLRAGARVATDKYEKESASDFALWKLADARAEAAGAAWDAPFGRGRPGWHIECSAMALRYLGETLDIHAGGIDLMFPHHENEIAQAEAATGRPFSRFWLHSEFVADGTGDKMSKSEGNVTNLRELVRAGHDPVAIRFFLLTSAHYRSKVLLTDKGLRDAAEQVRRLRDFAARVAALRPPPGGGDAGVYEDAVDAAAGFRESTDDDLNLPQAMGRVFELVRSANAALDAGRVGAAGRQALVELLEEVDRVVDVLREEPAELDAEIGRLVEAREAARRAGDFAESDRLRDELRERGVGLEDTRDGVRVRRL